MYLLPSCFITITVPCNIIWCMTQWHHQSHFCNDTNKRAKENCPRLLQPGPPARSCALMDGVCVFISKPTLLSGCVCCSTRALPGHSDLHRLGAPRPGGLRHPAVLLLLLLALDLRGRHLLLDVPTGRLPGQHFCKYTQTHLPCHRIIHILLFKSGFYSINK